MASRKISKYKTKKRTESFLIWEYYLNSTITFGMYEKGELFDLSKLLKFQYLNTVLIPLVHYCADFADKLTGTNKLVRL